MHGLSEKESKGSFISLVLRFSSLHSSCNVSAPRGSTWGMSVSFSSAGASRSVSMFSPCEDGWSLKWKCDENNDMLKLYGMNINDQVCWKSTVRNYVLFGSIMSFDTIEFDWSSSLEILFSGKFVIVSKNKLWRKGMCQ